jgi:hypothetical protein
MISSFSLPVSSNSSPSHFCDSCSINKSHRLPFHKHGLTSSAPFDLIYTDVWGPSHKSAFKVINTMWSSLITSQNMSGSFPFKQIRC